MSDIERILEVPRRAPRARDGHKGSYGHVLVVAGSLGMSGAAVLCGTAALRGGAGTVQVAVPDEIQPMVAIGQPAFTTVALPSHRGGIAAHAASQVARLAEQADVIAVGPGLGRGPAITWLVREILALDKPVVLDADGLNAIAPLAPEPVRKAPTILTPHPGEFGRLASVSTADVQADREGNAVRFAATRALTLVLKGAGTLVTDGRRLYVNRTGNPGLATGGSGDVLTGLVAALLAQQMPAFEAACLAVHLHGHAGDLAAADLSEASMMATDLLNYLPLADQARSSDGS